MSGFSFCGDNTPSATFKTELMALWIEQEWIPEQPASDWMIVGMRNTPLEWQVLEQFTSQTVLQDDFQFTGRIRVASSSIPYIFQHTYEGKVDESTGTYLYQFQHGDEPVRVLVASSYYNDDWYQVSIACLPQAFVPVWTSFVNQCEKFAFPEECVLEHSINALRLGTFAPLHLCFSLSYCYLNLL